MLVTGWILAWGLLLAPPNPATLLQKAEAAFENLEYATALRLADQVLSSSASGPADLARAYRLKGLCLSGTGKLDAAQEAFESLLSIEPGAEMSADLSPKLTAPFYQALARARTGKPIRLSHQPPPAAEALSGTSLRVRLESDPKRLVRRLRLVFESDLEPNEQRLEASVAGPGEVTVNLPAKLRAREVRYRFEALTAAGGVLAVAQDNGAPFRLRVGLPGDATTAAAPEPSAGGNAVKVASAALDLPPPKSGQPPPAAPARSPQPRDADERSGPWYQTWWFWTAVGVVVAGTAAGVAVGVSSSGGSGPVDYGIRIP